MKDVWCIINLSVMPYLRTDLERLLFKTIRILNPFNMKLETGKNNPILNTYEKKYSEQNIFE